MTTWRCVGDGLWQRDGEPEARITLVEGHYVYTVPERGIKGARPTLEEAQAACDAAIGLCCEHGLRRQCETCDLRADVARLTRERDEEIHRCDVTIGVYSEQLADAVRQRDAARDAALEAAAEAVRAALTSGLLTPGQVTQACAAIRALKGAR